MTLFNLPQTYNSEDKINELCDDLGKGGLGMKQIFPDPVSQETIKRKLDRVKKAEKDWKDYDAKYNC